MLFHPKIACFTERKLLDGESPHQLYIQNYSCASSSCLVLRKWIFDPDRERQLCQKDPLFRQFVFHQAVADVNEVGVLISFLNLLTSSTKWHTWLRLGVLLPQPLHTAVNMCQN